jgi:hypothetical protein
MPQALGALSFEARLTPRTLRHEDAKDRIAAQDKIASQLRTRAAVVEGRACLRMSTPKARAALKPAPHIEIDVLERKKRPLCRSCVDWSERKHHLGGRRRGCSRPCAGKDLGGSRAALMRGDVQRARREEIHRVVFIIIDEERNEGQRGSRLVTVGRSCATALLVGRFMRASCGGLVDVARAPDGWVTTKVSGWRSKRGSHRVVKEPLPPYAVPEPDWHPEKLTGRETEAPAVGRAAEGWPGNAGASR